MARFTYTWLLLLLAIMVVCIWYGFPAKNLIGYYIKSSVSGIVNNIQNYRKTVTSNLPPCGEICSYTGNKRNGTKNNHYTQLKKKVDCKNMLGRMAWDKYEVINPPLKEAPIHLRDAFTQNGDVPFGNPMYFNEISINSTNYVFTTEEIIDLQNKDKSGESISSYFTSRLVAKTIEQYQQYIRNKSGVVFGTQRPWIEAILLNNNVKNVTTLEYNNVQLQHPQISVYHPATMAKKFIKGEVNAFDFGVSFSSLEHSGLGRYGDPLNPYGDLEAMAQAWCMIKPEGIFILGIPANSEGSSYIQWNAHRVYGKARLPHLTANWDLLEHKGFTPDGHAVLVLQRIG